MKNEPCDVMLGAILRFGLVRASEIELIVPHIDIVYEAFDEVDPSSAVTVGHMDSPQSSLPLSSTHRENDGDMTLSAACL